MRRFSWLILALSLTGLCAGLSAQAANPGSNSQDNAFFAGPGTHDATLNGAPLLPGTAILQGETVQTSPGGVVVMAPTHGSGGVLELSGNSSATVHTGNVSNAVGTDQLMVSKGNAVVTGGIAVVTPQGQTFQPANDTTSYVVNADGQQTSMGVISGSVNTLQPRAANAPSTAPDPPPVVVQAGAGIQVNTTITGQIQLSNIRLNQVVQPSTQAAVPQTTTASQSQ